MMEKYRKGSRQGSADFSSSITSPDFEMGWVHKDEEDQGNFFHRTWDGFKRDPNRLVSPRGVVGANGKVFDAEAAAHATADSPLQRSLKGRHLQMIAIGGSIGKILGGTVHWKAALTKSQGPACSWVPARRWPLVVRRLY